MDDNNSSVQASSSANNVGWADLAEPVASKLGLQTNRSPTLKNVVERGVRYLHVDDSAREIVFDTRALFLGFLSAGQQDPDSIRYGNTASWFAAWLRDRVKDDGAIAKALQGMAVSDELFSRVRQGFEVVLSVSVRGLIDLASSLTTATVRRPQFEARHFFAAMIKRGVVTDQVREVFSLDLGAQDLADLEQTLVDRIMGAPEPNESRENWIKALELHGPADLKHPETSTSRDPQNGVPGFSIDSLATGAEILDITADTRALARLICLSDAAPLSIAIFGGWGSGKSTFMNQLDREVRNVAALSDSEVPATADGAVTLVRRVVQIRFNAWQFVDANLWASLTAEFFDQLRAGGWDRLSGARHSGLVERVNLHVHALNSELEAKRESVIKGNKSVRARQKERDKAADNATKAGTAAFGQASLAVLGDIYKSHKAELSQLGFAVAGQDASKAIDAIVTTVGDSRTFWGRVCAVFRVVNKSPQRRGLVAAVLGSAVVAILAVLALILYGKLTWAQIAAGIALLCSLGTFARSLRPALSLVMGISRRAVDIASAVKAADTKAVQELMAAELRLQEATVEADARKSDADEAARRLSRYVDPEGKSNPPRLLRYVMEDDPDTKALQAEIGLIGRTRRLFQAVADIVREERAKAKSDRVDGGVPERIVLYIDDLDRCTEAQVYAALQAIHLLLAFDLFVVVVGVDVEWVQRALAQSSVYKEHQNAEADSASSRQRTAQYLEKIFQIAFWLSPLSSGGSDGGSYARYVRTLATPRPSQVRVATTSERSPAAPGTETETPQAADTMPVAPSEPPAGAPKGPTEQTPAPTRDETTRAVLQTIQLQKSEIDFLASESIAAIAARTPRAVKRLVNIYRLARARLSESGKAIMGDGVQPPMYPIIALMAAIETGQPVNVADGFFFGLSSILRHQSLAPFVQDDYSGFEKRQMDASAAFRGALNSGAGLRDALGAVFKARNGQLSVEQVREVAAVVRRYSFNSSR